MSIATTSERPLLYVLATQPSTPNQPTTSEWIIELYKPPPTGLKPLSTVSVSKPTEEPTTTSSHPSPPTASQPERTTFSRFPTTSSSTPKIILRVAVASIPYQHSHQIISDLDTECSQAIESVHTTPDPASWLRQALLALQGKGILPPVSDDFDVTRFMDLVADDLSETLGQGGAMREVKYSDLVRAEGEQNRNGDGNGDEITDWSLPHRERKSVAEKGGGTGRGI